MQIRGLLPGQGRYQLVAVRAQVHEAGLYFRKYFRVEVLVPTFNDGRQSFEGERHQVQVVVVAVIENANDAGDDGLFEILPGLGWKYLKLLSVMRLLRTPRQ